MPLLFRKRVRRPSAPGPEPGAQRSSAESNRATARSPALPVLLDTAGGPGVGLVAIWDLPGLNANGDYSDERDGQPPAKVKIQERAEVAGELTDNNSPGVAQARRDHAEEARGDGGDEQARRLERQLLELERLERAERGAQEAVLGLRREVMRLELENARLQASRQLLQDEIASLRLRAERARELEQADAANKELIDTLRERIAQLEVQQYQQYQYHQPKLDMHQGYLMDGMMTYGQFPMYAPAGQPLPDYGYALLPKQMSPLDPHHHLHEAPSGHQPVDQMHAHDLQAHELQVHQLQVHELQGHDLQDHEIQVGHALQAAHELLPEDLQPHEAQAPELQASEVPVHDLHVHEAQVHEAQANEQMENESRASPQQASSSRSRRKLRQCYNCQRFGHDAKQCKNTTACLVCSELGHSHKECQSEQTRCVNCEGAHRASSKECPARLAWSRGL